MNSTLNFVFSNWQLWAGFAAGWLVFKRPIWIELAFGWLKEKTIG